MKKLIASTIIALGLIACSTAEAKTPKSTTTAVAPSAVTTTTYDAGYIYNQCRENGPGRIHAIADINAYYSTWAQPEADAIVADINRFITVCNGQQGTSNVIKAGKAVKACFAEWATYLPDYPLQNGACYAYWDTSGNTAGNDLPKYHSALLASSR